MSLERAQPRLKGTGPVVMVDDSVADAMIARVYHGKSTLAQAFIHLSKGEALIEYLENPSNVQPSIIMLDVNMPGMSGFDTLARLRSSPETKELPVVVMVTSSKAPDDLARAEQLGADGYFVKPLEGRGYLEFFDSLIAA